jgi:transposase InsO family protein
MIGRSVPDRHARRVRAVLDLFRGDAVTDVSMRYGIGRSDVYKFRRRALAAINEALAYRGRGPRRPHNRLARDSEAQVVALCQRHPTWSSHVVHRHCGGDAPSPRTIQRIRARHGLGRFSKREPPTRRRSQLTPEARARVNAILTEKPYLGPERTAWDLQNTGQATISPSTIKRMKRKLREARLPSRPPPPDWRFYERRHPHSLWHGDFMEKVTLTDLDRTAYQLTLQDDYSRGYVFCDLLLYPDASSTIRGLIAAMRAWRTIPKAVVFDNGSPFKGRLLSAFCEQLNIRLIHAAVNHPQTNGKLERAFRDDMRDFYKQYDAWRFDRLRSDLPGYVHYRNYIRGHHALGGKAAISRLKEHAPDVTLCPVLDRLESYARYEIGRKIIPATGRIRLLGRDAYVGKMAANAEVTFCESLNGLEAWINGQCVAVLRDYRTFKQMKMHYRLRELPRALYFETYKPVICPRIAVAP